MLFLWTVLKGVFRPIIDYLFFYLTISSFLEFIPGVFLWIYSKIFEKTTYVDYMNFLDKWHLVDILAVAMTIFLLIYRIWHVIISIRNHIRTKRDPNQSAMG